MSTGRNVGGRGLTRAAFGMECCSQAGRRWDVQLGAVCGREGSVRVYLEFESSELLLAVCENIVNRERTFVDAPDGGGKADSRNRSRISTLTSQSGFEFRLEGQEKESSNAAKPSLWFC